MEQLNINESLNKYIDKNLFDIDTFLETIKYQINIHSSMIANCVKNVNVPFLKRNYGVRDNPYSRLVAAIGDDEFDIDTFIRRAPFFFHIYSNKERGLYSDFLSLWESATDIMDEEKFYSIIETLFYSYNLSLETIFGYVLNQFGSLDDFNNYMIWFDYATLVHEKGSVDFEPKNLLWTYNNLLIELNQEPKRYSIDRWERTDKEIVVSGNLPFNPETNELEMSWILLWANNYKSIRVEQLSSNGLRINIHIELDIDTFIYQYIKPSWEQLYVGPREMYFDLDAIKQRRKELKFTQEQVADIIGVSYRSYQYFETNRYNPNALQLFRLMNLLNFNDIEALIYKENIEDSKLEKFLSGKDIYSFLKARY